jgi:hypothetical protein
VTVFVIENRDVAVAVAVKRSVTSEVCVIVAVSECFDVAVAVAVKRSVTSEV